MQYGLQQPPRRRARQISFAEPIENFNKRSASRNSSPAIAYESSAANRQYASPLHNLHLKYLPNNYQGESRHLERSQAESVERINQRIQGILAHIEREENRDAGKIGNQRESGSGHKRRESIQSRRQYERGIEQLYLKTEEVRYTTPLKEKKYIQNHSKQQNSSSIKTEQSRSPLTEYRHNRPPNHLENSVYSNFSGSRMHKNKQNESRLKDRNIDTQISKIQRKMVELDQIKKQLNINFHPEAIKTSGASAASLPTANFSCASGSRAAFHPLSVNLQNSLLSSQVVSSVKKLELEANSSNPSSRTISLESSKAHPLQSSLNNMTFNSDHLQLSSNPQNQLIFTSQQASLASSKGQVQTRQAVSQEDVYVPKLLRNLPSKRKKKAIQPENTKTSSFDDELMNAHPIKHEISITIDSAPLSRESTISYQPSHSDELKRFLHFTSEQIRLDDLFRKGKKWFQRLRSDVKWQQLGRILREQTLWIDQSCTRNMFSISSEEENPFYTPREEDFNLSQLVKAFRQAEQHWANQMQHSYDSSSLQKAGLTLDNLDISRRGHITIEDLVRFLNYQMDSFYRNRDLYLIFHRLKSNRFLTYSELLSCLGQP